MFARQKKFLSYLQKENMDIKTRYASIGHIFKIDTKNFSHIPAHVDFLLFDCWNNTEWIWPTVVSERWI